MLHLFTYHLIVPIRTPQHNSPITFGQEKLCKGSKFHNLLIREFQWMTILYSDLDKQVVTLAGCIPVLSTHQDFSFSVFWPQHHCSNHNRL